jgi:hypothetical protein
VSTPHARRAQALTRAGRTTAKQQFRGSR